VHQLIWLASIKKQKESLASFPSVNNPEKSRNKTTKYKDKNPMSSASLNQFHNQVMQNEALPERLKAATDPESLSELEIEAAIVGECEEVEDSLLSAIVGAGGGYKMSNPKISSPPFKRGEHIYPRHEHCF
jgi:Zn-dependent oligopeptidase